MMRTQGIPYRYTSAAGYDSIAVLVIVNLVLDIPAVWLGQNAVSTCVQTLSACPTLASAWSCVAVALAIVASVLNARIILWFLPGAYQLAIANGEITLSARRCRLVLPMAEVFECRINIVTETAALRFNRQNRRDLRNWAKSSPEYSGSAVDFYVSRGKGQEVFSFPLKLKFSSSIEIAAAMPGVPLMITRNSQA